MGQFKDYMDLDEHPFTGLRKLSMPFKATLHSMIHGTERTRDRRTRKPTVIRWGTR